jgi:hypothetical protein
MPQNTMVEREQKKLKYYFLLCQPFSSMPPHSKFDYQFNKKGFGSIEYKRNVFVIKTYI